MISDIQTLASEIGQKKGDGQRFIIALVGAPAAGKSTLADQLKRMLDQQGYSGVAILPMDGFHLDNTTLKARGQFGNKGAPQTFDIEGFTKVLAKLRQADQDVLVPVFDRTADKVRAKGRMIDRQVDIIIVEGNYLLLNRPEWRKPSNDYDLTVFLAVPEPTLEKRLIQRWLDHGLKPSDAAARVRGNDMANAKIVLAESMPADIHLSLHDISPNQEGIGKC